MKMKKTAAMLLAGALTASMGVTVFADAPAPKGNMADIKATYSEETVTREVYSVDIEWGSLEYTYNSGTTQTWDPTELLFKEKNGTPSWSYDTGADKVKVVNHSNIGIMTSFSYNPTDSNITGTLSTTSAYLESAEGSAVSSAPNVETELTLSGTPSNTATTKTSVGMVNVNIEGGIVYYEKYYPQMPNSLGETYVYTTENPGIYRSSFSPMKAGNLMFKFKAGEFWYGATENGKLAKDTNGNIVSTRMIPVQTGHTYEFVFDTNNMTYTYTDTTN